MPRARNIGFFLSHRAVLVAYARRLLGCPVRADDLVQDAYLRFDGIASGRPLDRPLGYLLRIVRNLAADAARRGGSDLERQERPDLLESLPEDRPSPETAALHRQQMALVLAAMEELPPRTRAALTLYRLEDRTLKEVAATLGISVGLAHALVADGIDHCRRRLERAS